MKRKVYLPVRVSFTSSFMEFSHLIAGICLSTAMLAGDSGITSTLVYTFKMFLSTTERHKGSIATSFRACIQILILVIWWCKHISNWLDQQGKNPVKTYILELFYHVDQLLSDCNGKCLSLVFVRVFIPEECIANWFTYTLLQS